METLLQDLRYSLRMLLRNPGFTIVAVLALALGIGANSAIFSVVNAVLLRPLPYKNPEQLMIVSESNMQNGINRSPATLLNFLDWREQNQVFEQMAAMRMSGFNLTEGNEPERVQAMTTSPSFFTLLDAKAALGRTFLPEEEKPGNERVVVLSHNLWQGRFGSDRNIINRDIRLNGENFKVVGVMPADFQFEQVALWTPLTTDMGQGGAAAARSRRMYLVLARLKPGVNMQRARTELNTIASRLAQQYPEANAGWSTTLTPLREQIVGAIRPALFVLLAVVAFVLLIACANMANLLLARAATRQKEVAIRLALGATRGRLIRQFLTESVVLALLGGLLGLLFTFWAKNLLVLMLPANNPLRDQVTVDWKVLLFTLGISILTGVIFGLAPALQASKPDLNQTLKEGGKTSSSGFGKHRIRSFLVVAEVTLALMLLIGAGLLLRSFLRLQDVDPGLNVKNALALQISLPQAKYAEVPLQVGFFQQIMQRIASLPNVESVSADSNLPLGTRRNSMSFYIEGQTPASPEQMLRSEVHEITPNYFRTMGIPFLKGRDFTDRDAPGSPAVVIINQSLATRFFANEDPIGKRISLTPFGQPPVWIQIVGVAGDVRHTGLAAEPGPQLYTPYYQDPVLNMSLVVRTKSNPMSVASSVRNEIRKADGEIPVFGVRSLEQMASESIAPRRITMLLLGFFAVLALVLAAVGIYGIMSYSVTQRTHEVGIRMALGAQPRDILKMIVKQGMLLTLIGVAVGFVAAFAATSVLASFLYGVSSTDLVTFVTAPLILMAVAILACVVPARRATKVDPMTALRYE
ncbi:MAG TPA: ABC transporter permease [Pyrinomonadaceae bacterium]|jgi:putative ABC transport system permease protein